METELTHSDVIDELEDHFRPLLDHSPDGVYLWLDEDAKTCNERLARMFGRSVDEWCAAAPFLDSFIAPEDRAKYGRNFQEHVAGLVRPVTFRFRALRKDGTTFPAETDMVPITYRGHAVALHFVRQAK